MIMIITKYLVSSLIRPLLFSTLSFGGLVMISEFFRELNFYIEKKAVFSDVFMYLLFNFPWWVVQVLPVAVLLAVLFSLGTLAKNGEITAMKASGINIWRLIIIFLICGLIIGAVDLFMREYIIPLSSNKAQKIRQERITHDILVVKTEFNNLLVPLNDQSQMTIGYMNTKTGDVSAVTIDSYEKNYNLSGQIVAKSGKYTDKLWVIRDGVERIFSGAQIKENSFKEKTIALNFKPEDFQMTALKPEQMSTKQYVDYISRIEKLGIPVEKDAIQVNLRWAGIFSHIIVMLIGIPFALGLGSRHGKILSFTFALIFAFIFWGLQAVGQSLGENKVISPFLAAWLSNFVFLGVGIYLTSKIKK